MTNILTDLKTYLLANLNLTTNGSLTYKHPFIVGQPQLSDRGQGNMIALANTLNEEPIGQLGGYQPLAYQPRVQVLVRAELYEDGQDMNLQIVKALEFMTLGFVGASGSCYTSILPEQLPTHLGKDRNDKNLWSWNYSVIETNANF